MPFLLKIFSEKRKNKKKHQGKKIQKKGKPLSCSFFVHLGCSLLKIRYEDKRNLLEENKANLLP